MTKVNSKVRIEERQATAKTVIDARNQGLMRNSLRFWTNDSAKAKAPSKSGLV
jgi:hypothetical protein